jgi:hypothetical protein
MADLTVTETALGDGRIRYELGRPNWQARRIPDIRSPGATVQIAADRLIDIVVLGDGYTDAADFRAALTPKAAPAAAPPPAAPLADDELLLVTVAAG